MNFHSAEVREVMRALTISAAGRFPFRFLCSYMGFFNSDKTRIVSALNSGARLTILFNIAGNCEA